MNCDDVRWKEKHPEVSEYTGKVPDLDRFDSQFFMVHKRLGQAMDPMARKVLEHSYQAIYDSGLSPKHLNGKKVGVYIASSFSDSEKYGVLECISKTGYGITGYVFNVHVIIISSALPMCSTIRTSRKKIPMRVLFVAVLFFNCFPGLVKRCSPTVFLTG